MVLATFKNEGPIKGHDETTGIMGRRWALHVEWTSIALLHECLSESGKWFGGPGYYHLQVAWNWQFGYLDHGWYDGPHKSFSFGPFSLAWS